MKERYIIGNGGLAKEVLQLAKDSLGKELNFKGFIEFKPDNPSTTCGKELYDVLDEEWFLINKSSSNEIELILGIGDPRIISNVVKKFEQFDFPNIIHPSVVGHFNSLNRGQGNLFTAGCIFTVDIFIGSFNIFNLNTTIGHDCVIGDCNVFNPGVNLSGDVKIGNAYLIGTNATILQGLTIGSNSILGAASLATKDIGDNEVAVGVPAKKIKCNY